MNAATARPLEAASRTVLKSKTERFVLVLNNYPLDRVMREVDLQETPDHVLFGVNRLREHGYEPIFLPYPAEGLWAKLQSWLGWLRIPLELGDLQQQAMALSRVREADVVYAPCGSQTHLLQYLRALGLFRLPIVTLMHHPFPKGKLDRFRSWQRRLFLRGADRLPTLSKSLAAELKIAGAEDSTVESTTWGVDVDFYGPWVPPGTGVIATGRTGRDFKTFAQAIAKSNCPGTLIGLEGHLDDPFYRKVPSLRVIETRNEQPIPGKNRGWMKHQTLCGEMRAHGAIAIPLHAQDSLAGITSLMDALGLGRAVLMTRNRHVDLDIEREGIGFWLEPGDVGGWAERLGWIAGHPFEVQEMGLRARSLAETSCNSVSFSREIAKILDEAIADSYAS